MEDRQIVSRRQSRQMDEVDKVTRELLEELASRLHTGQEAPRVNLSGSPRNAATSSFRSTCTDATDASIDMDLHYRWDPARDMFMPLSNDGSPELPRTTAMIKKIPRRYTLQDLRRELHELVSPTSYDMLYLPVDSAKMTNRGYAFINFSDPSIVEDFMANLSGREWTLYGTTNGSKTAEVRWAKVQGRNETLSHIRNELSDR
jgi:hypothetical protein